MPHFSNTRPTAEAMELMATLNREVVFWQLVTALILAQPLLDEPIPEDYSEVQRSQREELQRIQAAWLQNDTTEYGTRMMFSMYATRLTDAFLHYLSRVLTSVYRAHPEVLKSERQVTVREVMEAGDIAEFARRYADTVVERQAMLGFEKLIAELNIMLNLRFDTQTPEYAAVRDLIEVRNIIAHNEGRVSRLFLQRTGRTDLQLEQPYPVETLVPSAVENLLAFLERFDGTLVRKFNI